MHRSLAPPGRLRCTAGALALAGLACAGSPGDSVTPTAGPAPRAAVVLAHLEELAGDDHAGRFSLDPSGERTVAYLVEVYAELGLAPVGDAHAQPVWITGTQEAERAELALASDRGPIAIDGRDLVALAESGDGEADGELVFVGYAAQSRPDADYRRVYDDLEGLDLRGKIAVMLTDRPADPSLRAARADRIVRSFGVEVGALASRGDAEGMAAAQARARAQLVALVEADLGAPLDAPTRAQMLEVSVPTLRSLRATAVLGPAAPALAVLPELEDREHTLLAKLERLEARGAAGVIVVRGPASFIDEVERLADPLPDLRLESRPRGRLSIPVVQLRSGPAAAALADLGLDLAGEQALLDRWQGPRSAPLPGRARVEARLRPLRVRTHNVLARLPGTDLADEVVVVGAHWDHIGTVDNGLCAASPDGHGGADRICNGADDNASGTAVVLALAQAMVESGLQPRRTVVFAHFTAEELDSLGAAAMLEGWDPAAGRIHSLINLDMVGRLSPRGLIVLGGQTSASWSTLVEAVDYPGPLCLEGAPLGDAQAFASAGIPGLSLFNLAHEDYHLPGDELAVLDVAGMQQIGEFASTLVWTLAAGAELDAPAGHDGAPWPDCDELIEHQDGTFRLDGRVPLGLLDIGLQAHADAPD